MKNDSEKKADTTVWRSWLLRLFAFLPICNGIVGFALAYTVLPNITPLLPIWLVGHLAFASSYIILALSAVVGLVFYMIHAKCCMAYPLKKDWKDIFSTENLDQRGALYVISAVIAIALYFEYLEHLQLLIGPAPTLLLPIISGVAAFCFLLVAVDRMQHFMTDHPNMFKIEGDLKKKSLIFILLAMPLLASANLMLDCFPFTVMILGHAVNVSLMISVGALACAAIGVLVYAWNVERTTIDTQASGVDATILEGKPPFFVRYLDRILSIIFLLMHSAAEAGLSAHGAQLFGLTHGFSPHLALIFAMIFLVINLCLEGMVDGTEVLQKEGSEPCAGGHDHGLKIVSFLYNLTKKSTPSETEHPFEVLKYDDEAFKFKKFERLACKSKDAPQQQADTLPAPPSSELYQVRRIKPFGLKDKAVRVMGIITAGCVGLIGGLELHSTLSIGLSAAMVLGVATLLVEGKFISKQIERFSVKYISLCSKKKFDEVRAIYQNRNEQGKEKLIKLAQADNPYSILEDPDWRSAKEFIMNMVGHEGASKPFNMTNILMDASSSPPPPPPPPPAPKPEQTIQTKLDDCDGGRFNILLSVRTCC